MLSTPLLRTVKFPLATPTSDDFRNAHVRRIEDDDRARAGECFKTNDQKVPLPACLKLSQLTASSVFKKAGPLSNKQSTSATMWMVAHQNELQSIDKTWAGRLLRYHQRSINYDRYFVLVP